MTTTSGSPYTLAQAQSYISNGRLGSRITWKQANPIAYLESDVDAGTETYDVAVLAHSLWYFQSPTLVIQTLERLAKRVKRVCIAEWSLSSDVAQSHILAVLTHAALECRKATSVSNIRTVLTPERIKTYAETAGLELESDVVFKPTSGILDGEWEVGAVLDGGFTKDVEEYVKDEREKCMVLAMRDAVEASVQRVGGIKNVVPMDVWCGVFISKARASL